MKEVGYRVSASGRPRKITANAGGNCVVFKQIYRDQVVRPMERFLVLMKVKGVSAQLQNLWKAYGVY